MNAITAGICEHEANSGGSHAIATSDQSHRRRTETGPAVGRGRCPPRNSCETSLPLSMGEGGKGNHKRRGGNRRATWDCSVCVRGVQGGVFDVRHLRVRTFAFQIRPSPWVIVAGGGLASYCALWPLGCWCWVNLHSVLCAEVVLLLVSAFFTLCASADQ